MSIAIPSRGKVVVGPYLGYVGRAQYDAEAELFQGEVLDARDVVAFEGATVGELAKSFQTAVDDYLKACAERKESPDKPASGKFLVRVPPEIHRKLVALANLREISLNKLVTKILKNAVRRNAMAQRQLGRRKRVVAKIRKMRRALKKSARKQRRGDE